MRWADVAAIRRYADVIVHRQLEAALASPEPKFYLDTEGVAQAAAQCTTKKDAARRAFGTDEAGLIGQTPRTRRSIFTSAPSSTT